MKRYLVFCGDVYYPNGGMNDFRGGFDDEDNAITKCKELSDADSWAHVWDCDTMRIVWEG